MTTFANGKGTPVTEDVTVITAAQTRHWPDYRLIIRNRGLIDMLVKRQIRGKYRQTFLGVFWALVQPVSYMVVLNVFFSLVGAVKTGTTPYPLILLSGVMAHQFFARAMSDGASSLVSNEGLLGKIYIPRIIFPVVAILVASVDLFIVFVFFLILLVLYGVVLDLHWNVLFIIPTMGLLALLSIGTAITFAALGAKYRDLRLALPTVAQLLFFASPIFYSFSMIPAKYQIFVALNPLVGIIEGIRWSFLPHEPAPDPIHLVISFLISLVLLVFGLWYFQRVERELVDAL